jgi:uncharacterized protein YggT (Ycf19 family)
MARRSSSRLLADLITGLLSFFLFLVSLILFLRVVLRLFGANQSVPFVAWVYDSSATLMEPFRGIFPTPVIEGGFVIDFPALFALIVYVLIGYLIIAAIDWLVGMGTEGVERTTDRRTHDHHR